jgi:hypothetical protein
MGFSKDQVSSHSTAEFGEALRPSPPRYGNAQPKKFSGGVREKHGG